jgi:outer membrane protein OmpA-like peptidoglycan-associated protein
MRTYQLAARCGLPAALGFSLLSAIPLGAQQRHNLVEVNAAGAYQSFASATDLDGALGAVGRLGVWLPANFSLEVAGSFASPKTTVTDILGGTTKQGIKFRTLSGSLLYNILIGTKNSFYLKAGVGSTKYGSACPPPPSLRGTICGSSGSLIGGLGLRAAIMPTLLIRGEGELNRNKSSSRSLTNVGVSLGLSVMLGSKPIPDSDGDGVQNNRDRCPETPTGAQVDNRGCPSDDDGDGVLNGVDSCPASVAGAEVDASGCPKDSDGDNIPDGLDRCPDTPAGVLVDPNGCAKDSDGDAIPDGLDRCSETPRGATVDALGCPGDEDGDGVLDGLDRCPRTPTGATVTPTGCVAGQAPGQPAPAVSPSRPSPDTTAKRPRPEAARPQPRAQQPPSAAAQPPPPQKPPAPNAPAAGGRIAAGVIPGVAFAPGTARLLPSSYQPLDSVAALLVASPKATVEIGAHTDNSGSPAQNLRLTGLQADAVRDYLVLKGVPYQQISAEGYGATLPRTPDTTPRGRAANRRVEIRLITPGP